uniref:At1g61320/AtMIF1 LRR domain-containing protein n=1 Tax=Arundo donax TaxID=35708 RepID=A0A0A9CV33_ARUDO
MKNLYMHRSSSVFDARAKLPSSMPNLEALTIHSCNERASTPMLHSKFIHLRHLSISLIAAVFSPGYDYLSLASFLDAAPSLETFNLNAWQRYMEHVSIFADTADLRWMREQHHHNLKSVRITAFCSAKSLVELTCHILESVTSLESLTLEAPQSILRCSAPYNKSGKCSPMARDILLEAHRGVLAIRRYIEPKVPSTVKLHVLEPCSCHAVEL